MAGSKADGSVSLLSIARLTLRIHAQCVLRDVTMAVRRGEIAAVVGESGCGKSTLLRAVIGVLPDGGIIDGGAISFCGTELLDAAAYVRSDLMGRDIAVLFQDPGAYLNPIRRIGAQFSDYLKAHGAGRDWREGRPRLPLCAVRVWRIPKRSWRRIRSSSAAVCVSALPRQ